MDSLSEEGLHPVGSAGEETYGQAAQGSPAFRNWMDFEAWLTHPADRSDVDLKTLAWNLPIETRAHLAIRCGGAWASTACSPAPASGFLAERRFAPGASQVRPLPLVPRRNVAGRDLKMERQIAPLGGERPPGPARSPASKEWPRLPEAVTERIVAMSPSPTDPPDPSPFREGALPGWNSGPWPLGGPSRRRSSPPAYRAPQWSPAGISPKGAQGNKTAGTRRQRLLRGTATGAPRISSAGAKVLARLRQRRRPGPPGRLRAGGPRNLGGAR